MTKPSESDDSSRGWRGSREVWLAAARNALVESGIEAVKIQPLADRLKLARTSFYWFFRDRAELLEALLDDWEASNTRSVVSATQAFAETITEAILNVTAEFLPGGRFEPRVDLAVRGWAHGSDAVAARVHAADEARLGAIRSMFRRFGFQADDADVRARTMYLVQIGYIAMQVNEDLPVRLSRIPHYVRTYAGRDASDPELARFRAGFDIVDSAGNEQTPGG